MLPRGLRASLASIHRRIAVLVCALVSAWPALALADLSSY